ncbi:MAG: head-tail adaptor protein [Rhodobacteraceae bacterium]|nr:head-tail adaptor protein [Paracoccaceae bacterium]
MSTPRLNRKLVLEERQKLPDGMGGFSESWVAKGALWASINAVGASEQLLAARELPVMKFKIITRAAPFGAASRPRPEQRFREGGRRFDILAVGEYDPAGQYLEIWAEEGRQ